MIDCNTYRLRHNLAARKYRATHKEEISTYNKTYYPRYYLLNTERIKKYQKNYQLENNVTCKERSRQYRKSHVIQIAKSKAQWVKHNMGHLRAKYHVYMNSPQYRIAATLRSRLRQAIKHNYKTGSAVRDLGCTVDFLKKFLESKFQPGMSWATYGQWHIDHIIPLDSFDLTNREQFLQACNYQNLQPLWAIDNLVKGAA